MKGTLFGVGVGPGDPELMTLKAVRMIRENEVIAQYDVILTDGCPNDLLSLCQPVSPYSIQIRLLQNPLQPASCVLLVLQEGHKKTADRILYTGLQLRMLY